MSKTLQKAPDLSAVFAERTPFTLTGDNCLNNPYYLKFFRSFGNAFDTIFRYIAHADNLEEQCLRQALKAGDNHVLLIFSTHEEFKVDKDRNVVPTTVHKPSDDIFLPMFQVIQQLAGKDEALSASVFVPGLYELRISDPRAGLHLLDRFLKEQELGSADLPYGEMITINGAPAEPLDEEKLYDVLRYVPPQIYPSGAAAQSAGQFVVSTYNGYPFSLQYMLALIEQAETPRGKPCVFTKTLESFRLQ